MTDPSQTVSRLRRWPFCPWQVWIHGGAFIEGSVSFDMYQGQALAATGPVVVVCLQYRLGILG